MFHFGLPHCTLKKRYIFIFISLFLGVGFLLWVFLPLQSDTGELPGHIRIHDRHGILMTDKSLESGYSLPIHADNLAHQPMIQAIVAIEDKRFFSHLGVDILAKIRAVKDNILSGYVTSGASTITEQWVKNRYFLGKERTVLQKIREAIIALYFTVTDGRSAILQRYLNTVYLGHRIYGIQAASEVYFGKKDIGSLSPEEITLIISLIHNPSASLLDSDFVAYFEKIKKRLNYHFETDMSDFQLKNHTNVDVFPFISQKISSFCHESSEHISQDPIFFSDADCESGDFVSTIDASLSLFARQTLQINLRELADKNVSNACIFAVNPITREAIIYEGSRDFYSIVTDGQVDILSSLRQPGSTMKPFLYLMALKNGYDPDTLLVDLVQQYDSFQPGKTYTSENYTLDEYGLVRLKKALGNSFNNSSVRLAQALGLNAVYGFYQSMGFHFDFPAEHYGYSLVLGNPDIPLRDLVMSYTQLVPIIEKNGHIDPDKFLLYDILSDPDNRDISFGVNSLLNTSFPQAVKTGTSSNFRDNTLISYSPDMVIGLWFGNNDNSSMFRVNGITGAGNSWHQIVEEAIKRGYITHRKIPTPETIERGSYCLDISCFRREEIWQKKGNEYFSRIVDGIYDHRDIAEVLIDSDIQRLSDIGFRIK